jgi:hypothetical protein
MRLSLLVGLLWLLAMPGSGQAEYFWREPAFADVPMLGPAKAKGAILYSHGRGAEIAGRQVPGESHQATSPVYLRLLLGDGWDGFKLNRKYASDVERASIAVVHAEIARLRTEGYTRIVLAGQSYGAWLSILAATEDSGIHAVIATAPGVGAGAASIDAIARGAQKLGDFVETIKPSRVALFMFEGDYLEATDRGERLRRILSTRGLDNFVVNRPRDLSGHHGARTGRFARRYGECLVAFIAPDTRPGNFTCRFDGRFASGSDIPLAERVTAAALPPSHSAFAGRWYGDREDGGARLLVVTRLARDGSVEAYYAGAQVPHVTSGRFGRRVRGSLAGDALVFPEKAGTLSVRRRDDSALDLTWSPADGRSRVETVLRRQD